MNARGKQLTSFENWKSEFIKFLETQFGGEEYIKADKSRKSESYSYKDYFCYSIEHQWTDLFWTYLKEDYLNLETSPNGCLHVGFGPDRQSRKQILPEDPKTLFRIRTERTGKGWQAEYRIPGTFLREYYPDFRFSGILKANVYKCGDKTVHPHYLAWNPVASAVPDYHRPECFGELVFG